MLDHIIHAKDMSHVTSVQLLLGLAVGAPQSGIEVEVGEVHHPTTIIDDVPLYPQATPRLLKRLRYFASLLFRASSDSRCLTAVQTTLFSSLNKVVDYIPFWR